MTRATDCWITGFFCSKADKELHTFRMLNSSAGDYLMGCGDHGSPAVALWCRFEWIGTLEKDPSLAR
jgi:hypothetical protein